MTEFRVSVVLGFGDGKPVPADEGKECPIRGMELTIQAPDAEEAEYIADDLLSAMDRAAYPRYSIDDTVELGPVT